MTEPRNPWHPHEREAPARLTRAAQAAARVGAWERARVLGDVCDALRPALPSLTAAALWYASQGLHVFPIQPLTKIPHPGSRGFKDATDDPETIARWWQAHPRDNIGIATGHDIDVIDIDGLPGQTYRAQNPSTFDGLDVRAIALTPRPGGMHIYIPATGYGNKAGIYPSVDFRGAGGYVLAPPSQLDDREGQHPGTYRFLRPPEQH